jgi:hypothetical protein
VAARLACLERAPREAVERDSRFNAPRAAALRLLDVARRFRLP